MCEEQCHKPWQQEFCGTSFSRLKNHHPDHKQPTTGFTEGTARAHGACLVTTAEMNFLFILFLILFIYLGKILFHLSWPQTTYAAKEDVLELLILLPLILEGWVDRNSLPCPAWFVCSHSLVASWQGPYGNPLASASRREWST